MEYGITLPRLAMADRLVTELPALSCPPRKGERMKKPCCCAAAFDVPPSGRADLCGGCSVGGKNKGKAYG
jgi:hypothetical protein